MSYPPTDPNTGDQGNDDSHDCELWPKLEIVYVYFRHCSSLCSVRAPGFRFSHLKSAIIMPVLTGLWTMVNGYGSYKLITIELSIYSNKLKSQHCFCAKPFCS